MVRRHPPNQGLTQGLRRRKEARGDHGFGLPYLFLMAFDGGVHLVLAGGAVSLRITAPSFSILLRAASTAATRLEQPGAPLHQAVDVLTLGGGEALAAKRAHGHTFIELFRGRNVGGKAVDFELSA